VHERELLLLNEPGIRKQSAAVALVALSFCFRMHADQSLHLGWDPSPSTNAAGYALYYGNASGAYDVRVNVNTNTTAAVSNLAGGLTYFFAAVAYDIDGAESELTAEISFAVPGLTNLVFVDEGSTLSFTNSAADLSLPLGPLTFALSNAPAGAAINPLTGVLTWTPTESQGPSTNVITVIGTDLGLPPLVGTKLLPVVVNEINSPPALPAQPDRTIIGPGSLLVTNIASDSDIPVNSLSYQLLDSPVGAAIDATGLITWTPPASGTPSTNVIRTIVTDFNPWAITNQQLNATNSFTVVVLQTNSVPPVFQSVLKMGNTLALTCGTVSGQKYQLQYSTSLDQTNWSNLGTFITATNDSVIFSDSIGPDPQRYYRVVCMP
jgi:hypothetical protein